MTNISKLLPVCGFAIAVALVCVTSAFKDAPKGQQGTFWVLKNGATLASTSPMDYEEGSSDCNNQVHFCGFFAPEDGSTGSPSIPSGSVLENDLSSLHSNPNAETNNSGDIRFLDAD